MIQTIFLFRAATNDEAVGVHQHSSIPQLFEVHQLSFDDQTSSGIHPMAPCRQIFCTEAYLSHLRPFLPLMIVKLTPLTPSLSGILAAFVHAGSGYAIRIRPQGKGDLLWQEVVDCTPGTSHQLFVSCTVRAD